MALDQIVICPSDGSAIACAGPKAVCPWNGNSYAASMTFAALASAASGSPVTSGMPVWDRVTEVGVAPRMYLYRSSDVGKGWVAGFCHSTLSCWDALIAC